METVWLVGRGRHGHPCAGIVRKVEMRFPGAQPRVSARMALIDIKTVRSPVMGEQVSGKMEWMAKLQSRNPVNAAVSGI